uniref:Ig-like domain-containing protein n=1 Tax=Fundulus heteroclitus TaxID=8078 RepID=A0A3Q2PAN0_FUNHE
MAECFSNGVIIDQPPSLFPEDGEGAVNLKCEQDDNQHLNMYWYRQTRGKGMELVAYSVGKDISTIEAPFNKSKYSMLRPTTLSTTLRIHPAEAGDSAVYYCASSKAQTFFGAGTKLTVLGKTRYSQKGKRRKTLVCVASGFYPDHVSVFWQLNNQSITDGVATDPAAKRDADTGNYTITSRLRVLAKHWFEPQNEFRCIVEFFDGKGHTNQSATVSCKLI